MYKVSFTDFDGEECIVHCGDIWDCICYLVRKSKNHQYLNYEISKVGGAENA